MTRVGFLLALGAAALSGSRIGIAQTSVAQTADELPMDTALDGFVAVQCARADRCGDIGPGRLYYDWPQCSADSMARDRVAFSQSACPRLASAQSFRACLADIAAIDCGSLEAGPDSVPTCSPEQLCTR